MAKYYLGVDGGGTNCRMRLTDEKLGTLAEAVTNRPANLQIRDGDASYEAINELIPKVFAEAGLDVMAAAAQTAACFGMAGARLVTARDAFGARNFPFAEHSVFDDIDIARAGAHEGEDGAVLIIGTGSAGLAMIEGERHQIGGWGFLVGDDMSGAIMGRELLRRSLIAHEGLIDKSPLTEAIMQKFGNDANQLMAWSFDNPAARAAAKKMLKPGETLTRQVPLRPADYGEFVPLVFDFYEKDDAMAKSLIDMEMVAIDQHVRWFTRRGAKKIAIVGGLGTRLMPLLNKTYGDLIVAPRSEPLHGALILARQQFG